MSWFYNEAPMPILAPIILLLLFGGLWLGRVIHRRKPLAGTDDEAGVGTIMTAALGLLALLLGFTFAIAVDRYDSRRVMVLEEANAIGTTYLRAQLLDEPHRSRISDLLRGYTENRLALAGEARDSERQVALLRETDDYQQRLWTATVAAIRPISGLEIAGSFVESMNTTLDIGAERKAARRAHVPNRVLTILLIYMTVSAMILGYALGDRRARWAAAVLLALLAMSFLLILDIDRPNRGGIREPQMAMEELLQNMRSAPPAVYGP